ncbi:hypothetical protein JAAARDRAFT_495929 [Jaapia argillacea MUCL 33604]|uniref:Uncharacterized protein n=1 Tax=Jaapia argillacea MUCL 33604 TaxID=933084 RepID=A0A067PAE7_9AGAM|nr:hypothetical protein JAAARDRAFT_495929 [Jaapia argillacea MUCL 33604]
MHAQSRFRSNDTLATTHPRQIRQILALNHLLDHLPEFTRLSNMYEERRDAVNRRKAMGEEFQTLTQLKDTIAELKKAWRAARLRAVDEDEEIIIFTPAVGPSASQVVHLAIGDQVAFDAEIARLNLAVAASEERLRNPEPIEHTVTRVTSYEEEDVIKSENAVLWYLSKILPTILTLVELRKG